jgi:DNA-binding FadR family transcriptional regulator
LSRDPPAEKVTDQIIDQLLAMITGGKLKIFHTAIAGAGHNSVLARLFEELHQPVKSWMEQKASLFGGHDQVYEQHEKIFAAIAARDAETARKALRNHLSAVGERLTAALLERRFR